jgi:hypothetical protein
MIETLIRDNETEVNTDIALFQSIIEANEGSLEPESIYLYETAKEKLADLLFLQSRAPQDILRTHLQSIMNKRKNNEIKNEIKEMEIYAGYTEEEKKELKAMKRFQFMRDQDEALIEFLIDQFTKRDVFFDHLNE